MAAINNLARVDRRTKNCRNRRMVNAGHGFAEEDLAWISRCISPWELRAKRIFDVLISLILLFLFSPVFFLIAVLIPLTSKGPVFFRQTRIGYLGKPFLLCKFRTMVSNALELGGYETSPSDPRITAVGRWLRSWSLDELPQLWNVVKGEMSLVGPRPTLVYQVEKYTPEQRRRLLVKPGMTGLAQIKGRNRMDWPARMKWDLEYIRNFSLGQDLKILLATPALILSRKGVY